MQSKPWPLQFGSRAEEKLPPFGKPGVPTGLLSLQTTCSLGRAKCFDAFPGAHLGDSSSDAAFIGSQTGRGLEGTSGGRLEHAVPAKLHRLG